VLADMQLVTLERVCLLEVVGNGFQSLGLDEYDERCNPR